MCFCGVFDLFVYLFHSDLEGFHHFSAILWPLKRRLRAPRLLSGRLVLGTLGSEVVEHRLLTRDHKPEDPDERLRIEASGGIVARQRVCADAF